jgi:hypothetical protein
MKRSYSNTIFVPVISACFLFIVSCTKKEYRLPIPEQTLQNDVIKRSLGPNVVGLDIEFAYAMALPKEKGKLVSAEVEASIPGAAGTYLEHMSFYTLGTGKDTGIVVGSPSVTNGSKTTFQFTRDTMASTLRYYYRIPEAARGKTVSFKFTAHSSNGETVSYQMGPYKVAKMDMVRNITVSDGNAAYISLTDMGVYTTSNLGANASKIDLIYLYRSFTTSAFNHALVSPAADPQYRPGITLPAGMNKDTRLRKTFNLQDNHLAQLQWGIYIDDIDFEQLDLSDAPNYAINLRAEYGVWAESGDGKYRAYIYLNSVNNTSRTAVISIKRYPL